MQVLTEQWIRNYVAKLERANEILREALELEYRAAKGCAQTGLANRLRIALAEANAQTKGGAR